MFIGIDGNEANVVNRVGSNHYAQAMLKALANYPGEDRFVIYLKSEPLADLPPSVPNRWEYRVIKPQKLWTQWRLPLDLYFHAPRPQVFYTPGHYAPRFCPVPTLITILDLAFIRFPNLFLQYVRGTGQLKSWTKYSVKQAAHIFTISKNSKRDVLRYYHETPDKVSVVYPGIDLIHYQPSSPETIEVVRAKYQLPPDYLLSVGTIQPRKNYIRLLKAFEKLSPRYRKYHLVIVGARGWLTADFDRAYHQSKIKDRIHLIGFIPDTDLIPLYSGATCVPLVGLYEGFGLPAAQALACETIPVIANTASLPEVVGGGGIKVDPYSITSIRQGIMTALRLSLLRRRELILTGKRHIEQFSWQAAAKKVIEVCHALTVYQPPR